MSHTKSSLKKILSWCHTHAGLITTVAFLLLHLSIMDRYGYTWDFHFHFFGGGKLLGIEPNVLEPRNLPFVEPDPRNAWTLPYGALMSIPPVASYLVLYKTLHLLPADAAYHLPIIFWGIAGVAILYAFVKEAANARTALFAAFILALTPRYFGDMHNNMKDIPSAVVFALNIWLLWRFVRHKRLTDLLLAIAAFAIAFNVKVNSVFIPAVFACWLIFLRFTNYRLRSANYLSYFLLAPLAAFLLWWVFWPDPIGQLKHAFLTFGIGTNNIEVLLNGSWYCSGSTVPWYYPYWYLAITMPLSVLIFFLVGVSAPIFPAVQQFLTVYTSPLRGKTYHITHDVSVRHQRQTLLLLWLFIPLTRYLVPSIGVIDGIRHFEEALFPLAALAALGVDKIFSFARRPLAKLIFLCFVFGSLFSINWSYHPYQIAYFNELVGGAAGAVGKYDLDYWGTSQKEAVLWVNAHAPKNSTVHIAMAAAVAGQYLRPDLLATLNTRGYDDSDFVVILNRQSFFYRFFYVYEYLLAHRPTYTVRAAGAPLTWVYDNRSANTTPRQSPWWQDEDPCIIKYWRGERP